MNTLLVVSAIVLLLGYQAWVSGLVLRSPVLEPQQKMSQAALVWLLPLAGAVTVHLIHRAQCEPDRSPRSLVESQADQGVSPRDFSNPGHE